MDKNPTYILINIQEGGSFSLQCKKNQKDYKSPEEEELYTGSSRSILHDPFPHKW